MHFGYPMLSQALSLSVSLSLLSYSSSLSFSPSLLLSISEKKMRELRNKR